MKVLVIGAHGLIGREVVALLSKTPKYEVIEVGHSKGHLKVDITSPNSIAGLFEHIGNVDAIISTAGRAHLGTFELLSEEDFWLSIHNKLMGQVNLIRYGYQFLNPEGMIILSSGVLAKEPMYGTSSVSMANAAINGFVKAVALETIKGHKVNVVSPPFVKETMEILNMDSSKGTPAKDVALIYKKCLEDNHTGKVYDVRKYI
ncbi:short chain dehydrogenase [Halosquirtibacter xylanolyticus]|uniref:short chain dehydrogenase n=1 Tax=Halosquirtibacter xylanolyticus TaxID=3374599 RepID=UPI00374A644A|nr:short chain dehydrogenase [Prolixibacteraceae bacterium]